MNGTAQEKTIPVSLREARKSRGLTQEKLGLAIGATAPMVSKWEKGKATPTGSAVVALAMYFNLAPDSVRFWFERK